MNKFKHFRKINNLSQIEVANALQIAQSSYSAYETGKNEPDIKTLISLAQLFHTTIDELLGVSQPDLLNKNLLSTEERNIVDNLPNLSRDNLMKVEAYVFAKLEEQKSNK